MARGKGDASRESQIRNVKKMKLHKMLSVRGQRRQIKNVGLSKLRDNF